MLKCSLYNIEHVIIIKVKAFKFKQELLNAYLVTVKAVESDIVQNSSANPQSKLDILNLSVSWLFKCNWIYDEFLLLMYF